VRAIFLAAFFAAPFAHAEGRTSSLSWVRLEGAESCIALQPLAHAVEERLGRPVFASASEADLSVEGRAWKKGRTWHAHVEMREKSGALLGTRDLESNADSCDALTRPLTLVLALMIDPEAPRLAPEEKAVVSEGGVIVIPVPPRPVPKKKEFWRLETEVGPVIAAGLVPSVGAGLAGAGVLVTPLAPVAGFASGQFFFENTVRPAPGKELRAALVRGTLALCPAEIVTDRLIGSVCLASALGVFLGRGESNVTEAKPHIDVGVEARISLRIVGPIAISASNAAIVPLLWNDLKWHDAANIEHAAFRTSPVAGIATVALGVRIP